MKRARFLVLLAVFVVVLALPAFAVDWQPIYEGVDFGFIEKTSPRLMKAFALRIDTWNPYVSFFATPDNGSAPRETTRQTTPNFRAAYGLEAAVNANFFSTDDPNYAYVQGLLISNGTYVSYDEVNRQAQLRIAYNKAASIAFGGNPSGIHTAVAGDWLVVQNGANVGDPNSPINPMTGVGVSQDGRYVIWVVVDGRQPGWSDGARYSDLGQFLIDFGAYNGYAADGGGSSCICTASGGILNRPSDGAPRKVGANIGVNTVDLPPLANPPYEFRYDTQYWTPGHSSTGIAWAGPEWGWPGCIYFDQTGTDCFVYGPRTNFAGYHYPQVINVSLYPQSGNTAAHEMQAFFSTNAENYFDAAKSSPMVNYTCRDAWTAINLDVNNPKWWGQTISRLRLDMDHNYNSGTRYIINHVVVQNQLWWTFDSSTQGWVAGHSLTSPYYEGCCGWPGVLVTDQIGHDAYMYSPEISGDGFPYRYLGGANDKIHVRVYPQYGTTANHNMKVYWITEYDTTWDEAKAMGVDFVGQNQWVDVYIPVGTHPRWGLWERIKQIRLDFDHTNTGTRWIVDYIRTEY